MTDREKTREENISIIEQLYPLDSEFPESRGIGIRLLEEAKRNLNGSLFRDE